MSNLLNDSSAFILQKDVILCRSGKQVYHKKELTGFITETNKPKVDKDFYIEYRPPSVIVEASKLFKSLPVTKEHPIEFVNPTNASHLMGGVTDKQVEVVALHGESEGEIGLKTGITFYTQDLFDYYKQCNREVSVGYSAERRWVDNPEELGYDIVLERITDVNHLAITKAGRGGSDVAIIDSIQSKGDKNMKTKEFAKICANDRMSEPCADIFEKAFKSGNKNIIMDSLILYPDTDEKKLLTDFICDSFEFAAITQKNMESVKAKINEIFDSMCKSVDSDEEEKTKDTSKCADEEDEEDKKESKDSEEEKEDKKESEDSEEEKEDKKDDKKDKKESKDSLAFDKSFLKEIIKEALTEMKAAKDSQSKIADSLIKEHKGGMTLDNSLSVRLSETEYSEFINS